MITKLRAFDRGIVRIVTNLLLLIIMIPGYFTLASGRAAYVDYFYYLYNIPCQAETFGPEHAICEGHGFCPTDTIFIKADEGYLCPNGASVYHQANLGGAVGGPQISANGTTFDLLTARAVHIRSFFSSCSFLSTPTLNIEKPENCTIGDQTTDPTGGTNTDNGGTSPSFNWGDIDGTPRYCYQTCTQNCFRYCDEFDPYGPPGNCDNYSAWECGEASCTVDCY